MTRGYARVSTQHQDLGRQIQDLNQYGCDIIYQEKISGKLNKRPELDKMLEEMQAGDVIVIHKLDRLGRSLQHLIELVNTFKDRGVDFISLKDNFNTTTPQGKLIFNIMGSIAEFERELILERVNSGIKHAKQFGTKTGRAHGRPDKTKDAMFVESFVNAYLHGDNSVVDLCKQFEISKPTAYKILKLNSIPVLKQKLSA